MSDYQYNPAYEASLREASGWQREAIELRAKLKVAKAIITEAFCAVGVRGQHDDNCEGALWAYHHRYLPATHPARANAPKCNCWVSRAAEFLKEPKEQPKGPGLPSWDPVEAQKESTLAGRLSQPLTSTVEAIQQLKSTVPITPEAQAILDKAPRHADYCKPEEGCTCFINTMKLNGRL